MAEFCYNCFQEYEGNGERCPHCGFNSRANKEKYPLALPNGSILHGRYKVGRVLGQGGFGITYLAQNYTSKQLVAIKEYFPDSLATRRNMVSVSVLSGDKRDNYEYGKKLFLDEAKTMAALKGQENVAEIYEYFEENGTAYFSMEYVPGMDFATYIKNHGGRLPFDEAIKIAEPVMNALEAMHHLGLVHRDVTPDNIRITEDGRVKLLDFGAARYSVGDVTKSLEVVLKHGFAPVEQYSRHGKQGPFTDIYSLCATIYYAITGKKPMDSVDRLDEDVIALPSALGAQITHVEEEALLHGLAVRSQDRYQNIAQLRKSLCRQTPVPGSQPRPDQLITPDPTPVNIPDPQPVPDPDPIVTPKPQPEITPAPAPEPFIFKKIVLIAAAALLTIAIAGFMIIKFLPDEHSNAELAASPSIVVPTMTPTPTPTPRILPTITIIPDNISRVYDGTEVQATEYHIIGNLQGYEIKDVYIEGTAISVGTVQTTIGSFTLLDPQGKAVSGVELAQNQTILTGTGSLTVTRRALTVTAVTAELITEGQLIHAQEVKADGFQNGYKVDGLANGHRLKKIHVTGSGTESFVSNIDIGSIQIIDKTGTDVTSNYEISVVPGEVSISPAPRKLPVITIVPVNASKEYDGTELRALKYIINGDLKDYELKDVVIEGALTEVGRAETTITSFSLYDPEGNLVPTDEIIDNRAVNTGTGSLSVTPRALTITAVSANITTDGEQINARDISENSFDNGYRINGLLEGQQVRNVVVVGSGTESFVSSIDAGTLQIIDKNGNDVTHCYDIKIVPGRINISINPSPTPDIEILRSQLEAASNGDDIAMNELGLRYLEGRGVNVDYTQAVYWFLKAVEKGNEDAMRNLSYCYENGYGVEKSEEMAQYWREQLK